MKRLSQLTAALIVGGSLSAPAQLPPPQPWHLQGTVGVYFDQTGSRYLRPFDDNETRSDFATAAGDLRLSLKGFAVDPRFMIFNLDFNGRRGTNDIDGLGYRNTQLGWSANTLWLPERMFPLRLYYRKNDYGSRGDFFDQDSENSAFGADWTLRLSSLPSLRVGYAGFSNLIRLPTSISDYNFRQRTFEVIADDSWKGWQWDTSYQQQKNRSGGTADPVVTGDFRTRLRTASWNLRRSFGERKAELTVSNRNQWRRNVLGGRGSSRAVDNFAQAGLWLRHSPRLYSSYAVGYVRVRLRNGLGGEVPAGLLNSVFVVEPQTFTARSFTSHTNFQLTDSLRIFEEFRYTRFSRPRTEFDEREGLTETISGATYQRAWGGIDFSGSYAGRYQLMDTAWGNRSDTFSHDFDLRAGWGTPQRVRLVGSVRYSRLNLVEQLGGFTDQRRYRLEASTRRLPGHRLRLAVERARMELLNIGGNTRRDLTNLDLQLEHPRYVLTVGRALEDGAGALFPPGTVPRFLQIIDLPLGELIATPLLDRTTRSTSAALVLRLRRNLDLRADWRREDNLFTASALDYRQVNLRARYRIGKVTLEGVAGRYRSDVLTEFGLSGNRINRFYLRVARDFQVF